jgi:flagellar brake protein
MSFISSLKSLLASEEKEDIARNINPNFIVRPSRIKHMLQVLMESHVQLSVLPDKQSDYTSRILSVSPTGITLDQFNSREAHNKMTQGSAIQINAKHHAVPFNFNTTITGTSLDGGYLVSMPDKIYHPQKRAFFRVPLENIEKHKFTGAIQFSENLVSGYIYDVSFGGICIAVYSNSYVKKGAILSPASMTLKDGHIISD